MLSVRFISILTGCLMGITITSVLGNPNENIRRTSLASERPDGLVVSSIIDKTIADLSCLKSDGSLAKHDKHHEENSWPRDQLIIDWSKYAEYMTSIGYGSARWKVRK